MSLYSCNKDEDIEVNKGQVSINKIYGDGNSYCAFTSLIKRNGTYYCAFREGKAHVSDDGVIRIMKSTNGKDWMLLTTISKELIDLRDPNLSIMPDGKLLLVCGGYRSVGNSEYFIRTLSAKEIYNETFSDMEEINITKLNTNYQHISWVWKVTWLQDTGYGIIYGNQDETESFRVSLVKTTDGKNFVIIKDFDIKSQPSEGRIRFTEDHTMIVLLRRGPLEKGMLGISKPPYIDWQWKELGVYLAGQDFIIDDNRIVCVTRSSQDTFEKTVIYWGDLYGNFQWSYMLPTSGLGGDTAYGGVIAEDNEYMISYYSMHETSKPSIYICKIPKLVFPKYN